MEVQTVATGSFNIMALVGITSAILLVLFAITGVLVYMAPYLIARYKFRDREKESLQFVLLQIVVPKGNEVKIDAAEQLFGALYAIKISGGMFVSLKPQPHLSFEIVALPESIKFYVSCHKKHRDLIEKQINGAYPDAEIKEVPEYNIFSEAGQTAYTQYTLRASNYFPVKTYRDLPTDPLSALTSALGKMQPGEGAAVQVLITPADGKWKESGKKFVKKEKDPGTGDKPKAPPDQKQLDAVENKISKQGFYAAIRVVVSSTSKDSAKAHLANIKSAFEQFSGPYNGFSGAKIKSEKGFIEDFINRYQPLMGKLPVLTPDEISSIFHFPNKSIETPHIQWLPAKRAPAPEKIPTSGLYIGKSIFRGVERPVFIDDWERRRHMYIIGRTGTGKTEFMKTMMVQDIYAGKGLCF